MIRLRLDNFPIGKLLTEPGVKIAPLPLTPEIIYQ